LFFFIVISSVAVIALLGDDMSRAADMLPEIFKNPLEFFSRYLGLAIFIFIILTIYLTAVSALLLYVFSGKLGVLRNAAIDNQYKFRLSSFFAEAKKLFFPLLWIFSIMLPIILVAVILIFVGFIIYYIYASSGAETSSSIFIASFLSLLTILLGVVGVLGSMIFTFYASIALAVEKEGVISSLKKTFNFIKNKPMSILFLIILYVAIIVVSIVFALFGELFAMIPVVGLIISIPYQLISSVVQIYLGIVMLGSLIAYYIKSIDYPVSPARKEVSPGPSNGVYPAPTYDI